MIKNKRKSGIIICILLTFSVLLAQPLIVYGAESIKIEQIARTSPAFYTRTVAKGKSTYLKVKILPNDADNQDLKWSSSNAKIVAVSQTGKVTGKKNGVVLITASATDGSKKKITWKITVGIPTTGIKVSEEVLRLTEGEEVKLDVSVMPEKASNKEIQFTSEKEEIAVVDRNGTIKGILAGTSKIILRAKDGRSEKEVEVIVEAKSKERNLHIDKNNFKEYAVISNQIYDNITIDGNIGNQKVMFVNVSVNNTLTLQDGGIYTLDLMKSKIKNLVFTMREKRDGADQPVGISSKTKMGVYPSLAIAPAVLTKEGSSIQQVQMQSSGELYRLNNSSIYHLDIGDGGKNDAIMAKLEGLDCSMSIHNKEVVMMDVRSCKFNEVDIDGSAMIIDTVSGGGSSYIKKLQLTGVQAIWRLDLPIETAIITSDSRGSTVSIKRNCTELTNNGLATYLMLTEALGGRINNVTLSGTGGTISGDGTMVVDTVYIQNSNMILNRAEIGNPKVVISSYSNQIVVDGEIQKPGNVIPQG